MVKSILRPIGRYLDYGNTLNNFNGKLPELKG